MVRVMTLYSVTITAAKPDGSTLDLFSPARFYDLSQAAGFINAMPIGHEFVIPDVPSLTVVGAIIESVDE